MHYHSKITGIKETDKGTDLIIHIPEQVQREIIKYRAGKVINAELRVDDNRTITAEQRKKIYATIKDISEYLGDWPEYYKEFLKFDYCMKTGEEYFSLSNCSVTTARLFINHIIDFVLTNNIPLSDLALNRTDDIDAYLYSCLKNRRCCICGQAGELHHVYTVGMGRNRKTIDDSNYLKMCLCREHHTEYHKVGKNDFELKHHVYGIIYSEE